MGKMPRVTPGRTNGPADVVADAGADDADVADGAADATSVITSENTPVTKDACVLSSIVSNIVPSCAMALRVTSGMTAIIMAVVFVYMPIESSTCPEKFMSESMTGVSLRRNPNDRRSGGHDTISFLSIIEFPEVETVAPGYVRPTLILLWLTVAQSPIACDT